ncbi:MAG: hypothetical protein JJU02_14765 [Cryomorphaceae bacterium]|nr:hypothetical protein [Cryomorphaceae bacterium]
MFQSISKHALFLLASAIVIIMMGCNRDNMRASELYILHIPEVRLNTNYNTQGTAHHRINTVTLTIDGRSIGTYDLPAKIPFTTDPGEVEVAVVAGISEFGINALRTAYPFYQTLREDILVIEGQRDYYLNSSNDSIGEFVYNPNSNIIPIEDFESVGLKLQASSQSDVPIRRTAAGDTIVFNSRIPGEPNQYSGVGVLGPNQLLFEVETVDEYFFPGGGSPVFVEMNYNCNYPFTAGLITYTNSGIVQSSIVQVRETNGEWRKMYINFTDDVSNTFGANSHKIFFGTIRQDTTDKSEIRIYLDNIKALY